MTNRIKYSETKIDDCFFCKLSKRDKDFITHNKDFYSIYDTYPVSPGHALIIAKRHVVSLLDIASSEWVVFKIF